MLIRRTNFDNIFREFDAMFNHFNLLFDPINRIVKTNTEEGSDEDGKWVKQTFKSEDGSLSITNFVRTSLPTKKEPDEIETLKSELKKAVDTEDYEKAIELREQIKVLDSKKEELKSLKTDLDAAVKNEDYEKAIKLRDKLKKLKAKE